MILKSSEIKRLKDLTQFDLGAEFRDLHNDYDCTRIQLHEGTLSLSFRHCRHNSVFEIAFLAVDIVAFNVGDTLTSNGLTIMILNRSDAEVDGEYLEFDTKERGYFYLGFIEDINIQFWAAGLEYNSEPKENR
ncbi:MAG: hypothetical protein TR69_WS6001001056 [candidate division WS6 bacterium OLB20]|uniref:Uncharacterized protein n=1 Tax=candidate division WS6 bacterium OLB20 TaxID=1617426 RepID=A0A136LZE7_9BACT|nr:MAG: hypothetical protein TR69_WS6001001056 [candidate division WS6 bacterium OLB20]